MKRSHRFLSTVVVWLGAATLSAVGVTLPAAASLQGAAPFFSDVRAFNTSYTSDVTVQMTYRCFIGNPCPAAPHRRLHAGPA